MVRPGAPPPSQLCGSAIAVASASATSKICANSSASGGMFTEPLMLMLQNSSETLTLPLSVETRFLTHLPENATEAKDSDPIRSSTLAEIPMDHDQSNPNRASKPTYPRMPKPYKCASSDPARPNCTELGVKAT